MSKLVQVHQGRGKTDFIIASSEPFFSSKGYSRVHGGASPEHTGVWGFMKLRVYALEKFAQTVPADMLEWLRDHGGAYAVNVMGHDADDDTPRFASSRKMRLLFGDAGTAMLFKLTFGGNL